MAIVLRLDRMMADRKVSLGELAEKVGTERRRALRGLVRRAARGQAQEQRRSEGDV